MRTALCDQLRIEYPIVLGGMGSGTSVPLVVAVSEAGGMGTLGLWPRTAAEVEAQIAAIRAGTDKPFAVNFLLFLIREDAFAVALAARPPVISFAWANSDQELRPYFDRCHEAGSQVMYMAPDIHEARRGDEAGADIIIAQGSEGGGHVGWMGTLPLVPMVVDAVAPKPVLAAGGIADGRGLAAALMLGARGALIGTRFLATEESPLHPNFKQAIVDSDGHDTVLTEIPDLISGQVWPGAMARVRRNEMIARWAGQEWALRMHRPQAAAALAEARQSGDVENGSLLFGQDSGLIDSVLTAAEVVQGMAEEAEKILASAQQAILPAT